MVEDKAVEFLAEIRGDAEGGNGGRGALRPLPKPDRVDMGITDQIRALVHAGSSFRRRRPPLLLRFQLEYSIPFRAAQEALPGWQKRFAESEDFPLFQVSGRAGFSLKMRKRLAAETVGSDAGTF